MFGMTRGFCRPRRFIRRRGLARDLRISPDECQTHESANMASASMVSGCSGPRAGPLRSAMLLLLLSLFSLCLVSFVQQLIATLWIITHCWY